MTSASACGKVILFGEHAVVYGRPAVAVPVSAVRARVDATPSHEPGILIRAADLGAEYHLGSACHDDTCRALQTTVRNTLQHLTIDPMALQLCLELHSQVPIARGMGSGTAVAPRLCARWPRIWDGPCHPMKYRGWYTRQRSSCTAHPAASTTPLSPTSSRCTLSRGRCRSAVASGDPLCC